MESQNVEVIGFILVQLSRPFRTYNDFLAMMH